MRTPLRKLSRVSSVLKGATIGSNLHPWGSRSMWHQEIDRTAGDRLIVFILSDSERRQVLVSLSTGRSAEVLLMRLVSDESHVYRLR